MSAELTPVPPTTRIPPDPVRAAASSMLRANHIPGLSIAVTDRDRLLYSFGIGHADIAGRLVTTPETAYMWFSMSKIVTATAALALADQGRLDLDAPVSRYLPHLHAAGSVQPTVRQLIDHTAGLGNPLPLRWVHAADSPAPDPDALLRTVARRRRAFRYPPGSAAHYTNVGYLALGQILSQVAEVPFEDLIRRLVLDPSGMSRTNYRYQHDIAFATGYIRVPRVADPLLRMVLPKGIVGPRNGPYLSLRKFYVDGPAYV